MRWNAMLVFLVLAGIAVAQEVPAVNASPGFITPDSPLYPLDIAIKRLTLLLTFDPAAKADRGLSIAQERLAEVQAMLEAGKVDAAQRAAAEHAAMMKVVQDESTKVRRDNVTQEMREKLSLEKKLLEHQALIKQLRERMQERIKERRELQEKVGSINRTLDEVDAQGRYAKAVMKNEVDKMRMKMRMLQNISKEDCDEIVADAEDEAGITKVLNSSAMMDDAKDQIDNAEKMLSEAMSKVGDAPIAVRVLLNRSSVLLERAREAFGDGKYGEAFGLARASERLARNAIRIMEKAKLGKKTIDLPPIVLQYLPQNVSVTISNVTGKAVVEVGKVVIKYTPEEFGKMEEIAKKVAEQMEKKTNETAERVAGGIKEGARRFTEKLIPTGGEPQGNTS